MSQKNDRGRGRGARKETDSRKSPRKPKLNSSRAPKSRGAAPTANDRRTAARSVFSTKPAARDEQGEFVDRGLRLQQVLAAAGYGSRRRCEEFIVEGRVEVDGKIVTELGARVFPNEQRIRVDGEALPKARPVYIALNKPKNTLCTNSDPSGRRMVLDFIPPEYGRLFPVGRLDQNSEGLIILTNDGALAQRLAHPSFEVPKKYRVQVAGLVDYELVDALKRGVHIAEGIVQADEVVVKSRHKLSSVLEITLTEGKNREIRRMLARVGHKVMALRRVQVGAIKLGKLASGDFRRLTSKEVAELYRMADARPDAATLDVGKFSESLKPRPVEVSELEEREAEKEAAREKAAAKRAGKDRSNDPNFQEEGRAQLDRRYRFRKSAADAEDVEDWSDDDGYSARRRAPKSEFREEFRSRERGESRRRARREHDDEERTIGPRKFVREEGDSRPDRFNEDASKRRARTESAPNRAPKPVKSAPKGAGKSPRAKSGKAADSAKKGGKGSKSAKGGKGARSRKSGR